MEEVLCIAGAALEPEALAIAEAVLEPEALAITEAAVFITADSDLTQDLLFTAAEALMAVVIMVGLVIIIPEVVITAGEHIIIELTGTEVSGLAPGLAGTDGGRHGGGVTRTIHIIIHTIMSRIILITILTTQSRPRCNRPRTRQQKSTLYIHERARVKSNRRKINISATAGRLKKPALIQQRSSRENRKVRARRIVYRMTTGMQ